MSGYQSVYESRGLIGLTPASAVTTAAMSGIDIHGGDLAAAEPELARVILALKPLNKNNDVLAAVAVEVFHQVNA